MRTILNIGLLYCLFTPLLSNNVMANNIDLSDHDYNEYIVDYSALIKSQKYDAAMELSMNYLSQLGYDGIDTIDYYEVLSNISYCYFLHGDNTNSVLCASLCLYTLGDEISEILRTNREEREIIMMRTNPIIDVCRFILLYCKFNNYTSDAILYEDLYQELIVDNTRYFSRYNFFTIPSINIIDEIIYNSTLLKKNILLSTDVAFTSMLNYITDEDIDISRLYYSSDGISDEEAAIIYMNESGYIQFTEHLRLFCSDVRISLTQIDTSIEFVFDNTYNYIFCAILKQDCYPIIIPLCPIDIIDNFFQEGSNVYSNADSVEFYNLIWSKLEPYINEGDDVFFAPDGLLYQMNIEVLQDANGRRANEKWNLHRVSSTRELCMLRPENDLSSAVLYGGLTYSMDDEELLAASSAYNCEDGRIATRGFIADSTMRNGWNYLPGTQTEVEAIAQMCESFNIRAEIYSGTFGNEESFKALSGREIPIIHLATHGFFYQNEEVESDGLPFFHTLDFGSMPQRPDNSLKRSGLILSGGDRAWRGEAIPDSVDDGILLAEEIAAMDLTGTELVVLSACETGLGEITSEGVFGLQRAFKKAGVQTVIMSLWAVEDNATSLFMQTFYSEWFSGKTKHDAFKVAQETVRAEYPDACYWASFIMLD